MLAHSGVRAVFCEDAAQVAKIDAGPRRSCPELEHVIVLDGDGRRRDHARRPARARRRDRRRRRRASALADVAPDDVGDDRLHVRHDRPAEGLRAHPRQPARDRRRCTIGAARAAATPPVIFLFLPLAHVARADRRSSSRSTSAARSRSGAATRSGSLDDLAEAAPDALPVRPARASRRSTRARSAARRGRPARKRGDLRAGRCATGARVARGRARRAARSAPLAAPRHARRRPARAVQGPRRCSATGCDSALTGAAPIGREVLEFFDACGVLVLEGYGMTETCAAATLNTPRERALRHRRARRCPGTEVRDRRRRRGPDARARTCSPATTATPRRPRTTIDGRLAALRRPRRDRRRRLPAHHRPQEGPDHHLERQEHLARRTSRARCARRAGSRRRSSSGDRRPYLVALLTLDPDEAPALAEELGIAADPAAMAARRARARGDPGGRRRGQRALRPDRADQALRDPRRATSSQEDGELTPTLKVKRRVVYERYAERIDRLYES